MGEITGRKVLLFCVAAFGTIIAVNLVMAWQAVRTFPGVEVRNSFVASQEFDARRDAQLALGWDVGVSYEDGWLTVDITGPDGGPADVAELTALVGRATSTAADFTPAFARQGSRFTAPADLARGNWNVRLRAVAGDGTEFFQRIPLVVARAG